MDEMRVEWLILADAATVVGDKLYLLGGGWDRLTVSKPPPVPHQMAVAASFRVPWNETNQKHRFELEICDADGISLFNFGGTFEVGRPAGLAQGQSQRSQIAVNMALGFNKLGDYVIVGRVDDLAESEERFPFSVVPTPAVAASLAEQVRQQPDDEEAGGTPEAEA